MTLTGITIANFPADIILDSGVVFIGATKFGVTRGEPKFTPNRSIQNIEFDGKHAPIRGIDRFMHGEPSLAFTMMELGGTGTGNQIDRLEPGNTDATVTTVITHTMAPGGGLVAAGSYVTDLRAIWERGTSASNLFFAVLFPVALCTKYELGGQNRGEGLISVEFVGRLDLATQTTSDAAYKLEYRTTLP